MTLLASNYDQSRHFNTENVTTEKKLRIKNASEELAAALGSGIAAPLRARRC